MQNTRKSLIDKNLSYVNIRAYLRRKWTYCDHAGATVKWDLFYFIITDFEESEEGQNLESGEEISIGWYNVDEVKDLIKIGKIKEDRALGVLFRYFLERDLIQ